MKTQDKIDVESLMVQIREEIEQTVADGPALKRYQSPAEVMHDGNDSPLLYAEELNYLNANWHYTPQDSTFSSHRPLVGQVITKTKQLFHRALWNIGLSGFLDYLRNFQANLVRHLNHSARYIEARNAKLFWNLINKVDNDIESINERSDRLFDIVSVEVDQKIKKLEKRIAELEAQNPPKKISNQ